jgi:hypothetical protein
MSVFGTKPRSDEVVLSVKVVVRFATRGKERLQCGGKLSAINQEGESMVNN